MRDTYSLYEAKAHLSAIIARVREGDTVAISYHGVPVAEVRPITPLADTVAARPDRLAARGELVRPSAADDADYTPGPALPGAFAQFLSDRE